LFTLEDRIARLRDAAPGILILDSGKVSQTEEPYIDFAFNEPPA
jgi:hypothetical protein